MVRSLAPLTSWRAGRLDPTTRIDVDGFWRASFTPAGPATMCVRVGDGGSDVKAWGPGADWVRSQAPAMLGEHDPGHRFAHGPRPLLEAQRRHPDLRIGASGTIYHDLLVTVLGQRITAVEAFDQWRRLTLALGAPAPGPDVGLRLPPHPDDIAHRPAWWFHPFGIETRRADTLRAVARVGDRLRRWASLPFDEVDRLLAQIPGVGPWTRAMVLGLSLGDPDAVPVGDFHLRHLVVHAFTGRARGTDDEMLELLAPFAPHRGRVIRLLQAAGVSAPRRGPRHAVQSIADR